MTTKRAHLAAILAMRMEWTEQDRLLADQLAGLRYKLDRERSKSTNSPATVPTAAGGEKPNPIFAVIDKMAKQESQLTRRLNLGAKRNASGRYEANTSPMETRLKLWAGVSAMCLENLMPGLWLYEVREAGVDIPEDAIGWPNNPRTLPEAGKVHEVGNFYPVRDDPPPAMSPET